LYSSFRFIPHTEQFTNLSLIQNNSQICLSYRTIHKFGQFPLSYLPYRIIHKFCHSHCIVLQTEQFTNYSLIQNNSVNLSILIELFPTQNNSQNCLPYKTIHIFFSFPLNYLPYKTILNFPPILTELFPIQNNSQILSFQLVIS
jgi:hypothetical protein